MSADGIICTGTLAFGVVLWLTALYEKTIVNIIREIKKK